MNKGLGQNISVIDAVQDVVIGDSARMYTFINGGTATVYYRMGGEGSSALSGNAAALKTANGAELKIGEMVTVQGGTWEMACPTGLTATVRVLPGKVAASMIVDNLDLDIGNVGLLDEDDVRISPAIDYGHGLTYTRTAINSDAGETIDLGGNVADQYARLCTLILTFDGQGTVTVKDDSNGEGGGDPVELVGPMLFGAGGGVIMDIQNPDKCPTSSVVNRHMTLVTTAACNGYAVVSSGA